MTPSARGCGSSTPAPSGYEPDTPISIDSRLPNELLQLIFSYLPTADLKSASLVSKSFWRHATDILWQSVCLADVWRLHLNERTSKTWCDRGHGEPDEHDDTPIIHKLYILATNPELASKVQSLTHRCHLPTPNIFSELPHMYFHSENLSQDPRLLALLSLAVPNLVNVHTLRIIYGHWNLSRYLIGAFLDPARPRRIPLRKLWLESCSMLGIPIGDFSKLYTTGLESIRIRRLRVESLSQMDRSKMHYLEFRLARGGHPWRMHNGAGGWTWTTVEVSKVNFPARWPQISPTQLKAKAEEFDACIWSKIPQIEHFVNTNAAREICPQRSPADPMIWLLDNSASTLTSLNLDWIYWRQKEEETDDYTSTTMKKLARLRFPNLRAFQLRNAVVAQTRLADDIYLLEDTFLDFLEAHLKIQCLAWPLDRFYSHTKPSAEIQYRTRSVVAHLANVLVDLRIDGYYTGNGETFTDESSECHEKQERIRRRRFISEFAPHMTKVEQVKIEGGIPRDEKKEILRALHYSPLKKIVLIGVTFPVGNTWGPQGYDLKKLDPNQDTDATHNLEEEDLDAIIHWHKHSTPLPSDFKFEASYGWRGEAPFLQTIALHHAATVEELKICGYNGSPILSFGPTITGPLLYPLRHFHKLRQLVISLWLLTYFEDSYRDSEIIQSWMDTRSPASTALVVVTPPTSPLPTAPGVDPTPMPDVPNPAARPQEFNRWAVQLKTRFTPSALAYRVAQDIGPHLSPVAKAQPGGVRVRASFCLGEREPRRTAADIFDLDIRIGRNDQLLEFIGPREEGENGRFWQKLEGRRWF